MAVERKPLPRGESAAGPPDLSATTKEKIAIHNKWALIGDGSNFSIGQAFLEGNTILPTFVSTLTSSPLLIGLVSSIRTFGFLMPQMFVAGIIENRQFKKPFMMKASYAMRIAGFGMAASALVAKTRPSLALASFFACLIVLAFADGCGGLPWMDIVARTIPSDRRNRLFGTMQAAGGIGAFAAGFLIRALLCDEANYPVNYFTVMMLGAFFFTLSLVSMHFIIDPGGAVPEVTHSLGAYMKKLPSAWAENPRFRSLMASRFLTGSFYLCLPFFAIHAQTDLRFPVSVVGLFVSAQMVGTVVLGPVWGYLGDVHGSRWVVRVVSLLAAGTAFSALLARWMHFSGAPALAYLFYFILYFCIGGVFGGTWIGYNNYILDISAESNRATLVGLFNTIGAPISLLTIVGGWLLGATNFLTLFVVVSVLESAAVIYTWRLPDSRAPVS